MTATKALPPTVAAQAAAWAATLAARTQLSVRQLAHCEARFARFLAEYEDLAVALLEQGWPPAAVVAELDALQARFLARLIAELQALPDV
jgi:hypothetical protein